MASQLLMSSAAVAAVVYITIRGRQIINKNKAPSGGDNWDPKINPKDPVDVPTVPICQIWDESIQEFVALPSKYSDSATHCFSDAPVDMGFDPSSNVLRYVDKDYSLKFSNPWLNTGAGSSGTCVFADNNGLMFALPGYAAVNDSERLCFESGDTPQTSGWAFLTNQTSPDGQYQYVQTVWNPGLLFEEINTLWNAPNPNVNTNLQYFQQSMPSWNKADGSQYPAYVAPPKTNYCEEGIIGITQAQGGTNDDDVFFYAHTTESAQYDGQGASACANYGAGQSARRYVDAENQVIVYWDPYSQSLVQRNINTNL